MASALSETLPSTSSKADDLDLLQQTIQQAAGLLPAQAPITVFVFDNTLRALEGLPFREALETSVDLYNCQPYWPEDILRLVRHI